MILTDDIVFSTKVKFSPRNINVKYEGSITYHSKAMANVEVFADKQTDRRTNPKAKNYMPPIYRCGEIKRTSLLLSFNAKLTTYQSAGVPGSL